MPQYYVYAYLRSKDSKIAKAGTPFYIGKGKGRRAWTNRPFIPLHNKYIILLETNLTELGAFALDVSEQQKRNCEYLLTKQEKHANHQSGHDSLFLELI